MPRAPEAEKMKFMGVRIPPPLQHRMDARLKRDGLGVSEYIRELIRRDLDAREAAMQPQEAGA